MLSELMKNQQQAIFKIETLPREPENKNFTIKCGVGRDGMAAAIRVETNNLDCRISEIDILKVLMDNGICVGIDYKTISEIITQKWFNRNVSIARGFSPQHGADAQLIPAVELKALDLAADNTADGHGARKPGVPVDLDQVIIQKKPATAGVPGFTVLGKQLEDKPGRDIEFEYGSNLEISADGLSLVSKIPGRAGLIDGRPCVVEANYGEWKYEVKLRKENMEAVIVITPGILGKPDTTEEMLRDMLAAANVKFGIAPKIAELIPPRISMTTVIKVASGKEPEPGVPASIKEHFKDNSDANQKLYKVKKDELLVERIEAKPGKPGMNALGEEIPPAAYNNLEIKGGVNTKLSEDGNKLISSIDGYLSHTKDGYGVVPVVDYYTEKAPLPERINFDGMVRVYGNVTNGRTIIAGSHVVVTGDVISSDIASGGMLKIHGEIKECEKTRIQSTGDMFLGSVNRGRIRSGGNVYMTGNASWSEIVANGGLHSVENTSFSISGGKIVCAGSVEAGTIGDASRTLTRVEAGMPIAIRARYEQTLKAVNDLNVKNNAIVKEIKALTEQAKTGNLPPKEYDRIKKLKLLYQVVVEKQRQLKGYLTKMTPGIIRMSGSTSVTASECAFPGTILSIGVHSHSPKNEIRGAIFKVSSDNSSVIIQAIKKSVRSEVTIVFTDIVSYSTYTSRYGDEAASAMVNAHNEMLFPIVPEFGGRIIKTIGDAIMAVFKDPDSAVNSAIKMQKALDDYNRNKPAEHKIKVRIGMNTGIGMLEGDDVFGDVVNMASRVEGLAGGDEIFISSSTFEAMKKSEGFSIYSLGMKKLKGKEELVEVLSVEWK